MSVQPDSLTSSATKQFNAIRALNHLLSLVRENDNPSDPAFLSRLANQIGQSFNLDRSIIMLNSGLAQGVGACVLDMQAEYMKNTFSPTLTRRFTPHQNSEIYRLLLQGKPLPITDIVSPSGHSGTEAEWQRFVSSTGSKAVVAFPLMNKGQLLGLLSMNSCTQGNPFTDEVIECGEILAEQLAFHIGRFRSSGTGDLHGRLFEQSSFPMAIVNARTGRIIIHNDAMCVLLGRTAGDKRELVLSDLTPEVEKMRTTLSNLSEKESLGSLRPLTVTGGPTKRLSVDVLLSRLPLQEKDVVQLADQASPDNGQLALVILNTVPGGRQAVPEQASEFADSRPALPTSRTLAGAGSPGPTLDSAEPIESQPSLEELVNKLQQSEELANTLSRQLTWERWVRQIISKMHSTLDRDVLLQTVVDSFGRALAASRCLIVRTDGPAAPVVTHEYAEPDTSPLGLGRTGQFPAAATAYFRHRVTVIQDLTALETSGELSASEYEYFADNKIRAMAGAPITMHGYHHGVIIILESETNRKWTNYELDMLEVTAAQVAVALGHSQAYLQLKDQLFNMNLLGNLTQQLTNTLEMVSRGGKPESAEERVHQPGATPPLSLRELEVLKLIASGLANREIAQRLFLTESTVELHASRIRKKLKLKSRTALVKYACDNGLA